MFEIGDYVLNATNGICKISEIVELDMSRQAAQVIFFTPPC